jgi:hypothetical protein
MLLFIIHFVCAQSTIVRHLHPSKINATLKLMLLTRYLLLKAHGAFKSNQAALYENLRKKINILLLV